MDYNWILLKGMRYYMETIKIQHLFGRFSIFFLVLIVGKRSIGGTLVDLPIFLDN